MDIKFILQDNHTVYLLETNKTVSLYNFALTAKLATIGLVKSDMFLTESPFLDSFVSQYVPVIFWKAEDTLPFRADAEVPDIDVTFRTVYDYQVNNDYTCLPKKKKKKKQPILCYNYSQLETTVRAYS